MARKPKLLGPASLRLAASLRRWRQWQREVDAAASA